MARGNYLFDQRTLMRRPVSRRGLMRRAAGAAGMAGVVLVGCAPKTKDNSNVFQQQSSATPPSEVLAKPPPTYTSKTAVQELLTKFGPWQVPKPATPPVYGGEIRPLSVTVPHLDMVSVELPAIIMLANQVYNRFWELKMGPAANNMKREITGDLVRSWESPDNLTIVAKLNQGVKFQNVAPVNGRDMTIEDVRHTIQRHKSNSAFSTFFRRLDQFETPDQNTIVFRFSTSDAGFLYNMASPNTYVFPPEIEQDLRTKAIGTGPYTLDTFKGTTEHVLVKNPTYWKKDAEGRQLPYIDRVRNIVYPDPAAQIAAFRAGELDGIGLQTPELVQDVWQSRREAWLQVMPQAPTVQSVLSLRLNEKPWSDIRVRQAVSMAIDRQKLIDDAYGGAAVPANLVPFDAMGMDWPPTIPELGDAYQFNPQKAKDLLAAAGYGGGIKAKLFASSTITPIALSELNLVQEMLKAVGVELQFQPMDSTAIADLFFGGKWGSDVMSNGLGTFGFDADFFTVNPYHSQGRGNVFGVRDPELDTLLDAESKEMDATRRQDLIRQSWRRIMDQVYRIPLTAYWRMRLNQPWVKNFAEALYMWDPAHLSNLREFMWLDPAPRR